MAGLVFSCSGRGGAHNGDPHAEATALTQTFGAKLPIAGMIVEGEIGPSAPAYGPERAAGRGEPVNARLAFTTVLALVG